MRTTIPKLRKMIRKVINESFDSSYEDDGQEEYDQERVNRMIMLLDDLLQENPELEYDEDAVFHALQGMVPDANEEEIAEAMASF